MPTDVESHAIAHQYPFASADILCSSKTIAQALIEGGWNVKPDNDEEKSDQDSEDQVNKMVRDSLNETNDKKDKKETLVEELDLQEDSEGKPAQQKLTEPDAEDDKLSYTEAATEEPKEAKWDCSLLDQLVNAFLATPDADMLPVLCGYFNKIIQSLLSKDK